MAGGVYGLLGQSLEHSFSPKIHKQLADYEYRLFEKEPNELDEFMRSSQFDGINVTIPYKKTVLAYCDTLSESARKIGSVNTIVRLPDGGLCGENTDYFGFLYTAVRSGVEIAGKKAMVLGSGGASVTVGAVLKDSGASEVVVISRSGENNYRNIEEHRDTRIIVNTTPVGMYPNNGKTPIEVGMFKDCEVVIDIVYNPCKTELLMSAEDMGIANIGGLTMLTAQAKQAAEIFTGAQIPDDRIDEITWRLRQETMNIALIGMPGAGKSTIGRRISEITGRKYYDSDEYVSQKAGMSAEEIINRMGEERFRELETDAVRELSSGVGGIIALGGGVVEREVNRRYLRQNSRIVFIDRAKEELSQEGRPLSKLRGVDELYAARYPKYREWSEVTIPVRGSIEETTRAVLKGVGL